MWTSGIIDIVESCATREALERLQQRQRPLLKAISREMPNLYEQIGEAFARRTAELNGEGCAISHESADGEGCAISEPQKMAKDAPIARAKPRLKPALSQAPRREERATSAEHAKGEACAKSTRARSSRPTPRQPRKRAADAPAKAPEPA